MCFQFRFKCRYSDVEVISDGARKRIPDPLCNVLIGLLYHRELVEIFTNFSQKNYTISKGGIGISLVSVKYVLL